MTSHFYGSVRASVRRSVRQYVKMTPFFGERPPAFASYPVSSMGPCFIELHMHRAFFFSLSLSSMSCNNIHAYIFCHIFSAFMAKKQLAILRMYLFIHYQSPRFFSVVEMPLISLTLSFNIEITNP